MLTIFLIIKKLVKFLNSKESVENISYSLTLALIYSITPFNYIVHPLILVILIGFNGNLFIFFIMTPILSMITPMIMNEIHAIGNMILSNGTLTPLFQRMSEIPILSYTNWNNTVSMGAYISSIILAYPIYKFYNFSLKKYRHIVIEKMKKSKLIHLIKIPTWLTIFKR